MDPEGLTDMLIPHEEVGPREKFVPNHHHRSIIQHNVSISKDHSDQTPPSQVIYTAVPLPRPDASLIFRHRADSTSEASSLSLDEEDAVDEPQTTTTASTSLSTFQTYSTLLGFLVGCFIQLSSLGVNYLLSQHFLAVHAKTAAAEGGGDGGGDERPTPATVFRFSLFWSILTSLMGVTILIIVREFVVAAHRANATTTNTAVRYSGLIATSLECYFAIGTLSGVCLAWTCTDVLLGFRAHFLHSLGTLVAALLWCKCISGVFAPDQEEMQEADVSSNKVPLLMVGASSSNKSLNDKMSTLIFSRRFKLSSILLGLITGFFIQFSSLGANFALSHFMLPLKDQAPVMLPLIFSLIWSIVTSGMGTGILTLVRSMILFTFFMDHNSDDDFNDGDDEEAVEPSLMRLEILFAVGALLGVNLAWIGTDLLMGIQIHYLHAVITQVLAILAFALSTLCTSSTGRTSSPNSRKDVKAPYYSLEP